MVKKAKHSDPLDGAVSAMVSTLVSHRTSGSGWLTWRELIERVPGLTSEVASEAVKKVSAKGKIIVAFSDDPNSPVVLKQDVELLAAGGELLKKLVDLGCSVEVPVRTLSELTQPLHKTVKKHVDQYWPEHLKLLPTGLLPMALRVGKKEVVAIHDERFPALSSDAFLRRLLQELCSPEQPEVKLSALAKKLPKELQATFVDGCLKRKEDVDFADMEPAGTAKTPDRLIRDRRFPRAEATLAEKLVTVLTSQKALGGMSYPTTWSRLIELTDSPSTQAVFVKAEQVEPYRSRVVVSFKAPDAPLALAGDEALLAKSPNLLSMVLGQLKTDDNQAVDVSKIVAHTELHPAVKPHFQVVIERQLAEKTLPVEIGVLRVGGKRCLFRWQDAIGANAVVVPVNAGEATAQSNSGLKAMPPKVDSDRFARDFDAAFARLDGKLGLPHYASLVDLRPALAQYPHDVFDRELLKLRQAGRYSLNVVEGRFGITDEERSACLIVDNVPHLLVSM